MCKKSGRQPKVDEMKSMTIYGRRGEMCVGGGRVDIIAEMALRSLIDALKLL